MTLYLKRHNGLNQHRRINLERVGIAGMKIIVGLYKAPEHKANSLKELARLADVGMSQVYSRVPILEKLGYVRVIERSPRNIEIVLTERGKRLGELLYQIETTIYKDYYDKVVVKSD